jgi:methyl-accepting chemotaxis protein
MLDGAQDGESPLANATANTRAMIETTNAIIRASTVDDVVRGALDTIRKAFGWAYASYWSVDTAEHALVFSLESGRVDDEFQRHTRTARFREGEGLNGRVWRQRELLSSNSRPLESYSS